MSTAAGIQPIADPRGPDPVQVDEVYQRTWGLTARVDPSVTFEEYMYWAKVERAEELANEKVYQEESGPLSFGKVLGGRFSEGVHVERKKKAEKAQQELAAAGGVKTGSDTDEKGEKGEPTYIVAAPTDEEWRVAARALRTSSWGTIFFLITTDILGWSTTP